jgi:hypothetical protein
MADGTISEQIDSLLQKLAAELVLAQPGSDQGMLPILDLLNNIKED